MFLCNGFDARLIDKFPEIEPELALKNYKNRVLKMLLEHDLDINCMNNKGDSALALALDLKDEDTYKLLLKHGAGKNQKYYKYIFFYVLRFITKSVKSYRKKIKSIKFTILQKIKCEYIIKMFLVKFGVDINKFGDIHTQLVESIKDNNMDFIKLLLKHNLDVNYVNTKGESPLILAIIGSNEELVRLLLEYGVDVNQLNNDDTTFYSINDGLEIFPIEEYRKRKIEAAPKSVRKFNITKLLLEYGVNVNFKDADGNTALIEAINYGNENYVNLYLEHGADVNLVSKYDSSLTKAINQENENIVKILIKYGADIAYDDYAPLNEALYKRSYKIFQFLLDHDEAKKHIDGIGRTSLLFIAINKKQEKYVSLLIKYGLDINKKMNKWHTPLLRAIRNEDISMIKLLIRLGADVNLIIDNAITPLTFAILYNNKEIIKLLLRNGANMNLIDNNGNTPMAATRRFGRDNLVKLLNG